MSTGTGERAREKADALEPEFNERFERDGILAALTWVILSTDTELRRVEGERDEALQRSSIRCILCAETGVVEEKRSDYATEMLTCPDCLGEKRAQINAEWCVAEMLKARRERVEAREAVAVVREQALREAVTLARERGAKYTQATRLTAHNVVEVAARAACNEVAEEIEALVAAPAGRGTP